MSSEALLELMNKESPRYSLYMVCRFGLAAGPPGAGLWTDRSADCVAFPFLGHRRRPSGAAKPMGSKLCVRGDDVCGQRLATVGSALERAENYRETMKESFTTLEEEEAALEKALGAAADKRKRRRRKVASR